MMPREAHIASKHGRTNPRKKADAGTHSLQPEIAINQGKPRRVERGGTEKGSCKVRSECQRLHMHEHHKLEEPRELRHAELEGDALLCVRNP